MLHTVITAADAKPLAVDALSGPRPDVPFSISPVIHPQDGVRHDASRTFWSAVANASYIVRRGGADMYGPLPDFAGKLLACPDLVAHGRRGPLGCEADGIAGLDLWRLADAAALADRPSAPVAWHVIGWLPVVRVEAEWREIVLEFLDRHVAYGGMIADWALHALPDGAGGWIKRPHMHAVLTARFWRGARTGQPQPSWLTTPKSRAALAAAWESMTEVRGDIR